MELVPTICIVMVAEFVLLFVAIIVIQFCKNEMSVGQQIAFWLIFGYQLFTFAKQACSFYTTFQTMVADSKIEINDL